VGAAVEDGAAVVDGVLGCVSFPSMSLVCLLDKGVYQVHRTAGRLVRADRREILLVGQSRPQLVVLRLGYPLQQGPEVLPLGVRPQDPQRFHFLEGGAVGQRGGR
jgi:hypothetical protein